MSNWRRNKSISTFQLMVSISGVFAMFSACGGGGEGPAAIINPPPASPPEVNTLAATSIGVDNVIINGDINPNGSATDAWFEWGTDSTLSTHNDTGTQYIGSGTSSRFVEVYLPGLNTNTTYYFRTVARNNAGISYGPILSFTCGQLPTVTTLEALFVTSYGAVFQGSVNAHGLETIVWFEFGTDSDLSTYNTSMEASIGSLDTTVWVRTTSPGLAPGTTYYYRIAASNAVGTGKGLITAFTTPY